MERELFVTFCLGDQGLPDEYRVVLLCSFAIGNRLADAA